MVIPHPELVNLYGCHIGDGCKIASFVEIQRDVQLGRNVIGERSAGTAAAARSGQES